MPKNFKDLSPTMQMKILTMLKNSKDTTAEKERRQLKAVHALIMHIADNPPKRTA